MKSFYNFIVNQLSSIYQKTHDLLGVINPFRNPVAPTEQAIPEQAIPEPIFITAEEMRMFNEFFSNRNNFLFNAPGTNEGLNRRTGSQPRETTTNQAIVGEKKDCYTPLEKAKLTLSPMIHSSVNEYKNINPTEKWLRTQNKAIQFALYKDSHRKIENMSTVPENMSTGTHPIDGLI